MNKRQDIDVKKQCNEDNATEPGVVPNPVVMGNNKNKNKSFFSESIINENQVFFESNLEKITQRKM